MLKPKISRIRKSSIENVLLMQIYFAIFFIYLSCLNSFSQDTAQTKFRNTIVKVDLVFPALGVLSPLFSNMFAVCVENSTFKNQSIQLRGTHNTMTQEATNQYSIYGTTFTIKTKAVTKNFQIIPEYRFYIVKQKLYLGSYLKYSYNHSVVETMPGDTNVLIQNGELDIVWHTAGIGGLAGFQYFIMERISMDFLIGIGIRGISKKNIISGIGTVKSSLADGLFSFTLGYRLIHKNK